MKNTTIREIYYFSIISNIFLLVCSLAGCIVMLINTKRIINVLGEVLGVFLAIAIFAAFVTLAYFLIKNLIVLLKDLKAVKNHNYITVTGKVIKFKRNIEPESGVQINNNPMVLIIDTGEELLLKVNDNVLIGEIYSFNYLKNCKIGEIVKNK